MSVASTIDAKEAAKALDVFVWRGIPYVSMICSVLYTILALAHSQVLKGAARVWMVELAAMSAFSYTVLFWLFRTKRLSFRYAGFWGFLSWVPVWVNSVAHIALTLEVHQATNLLGVLLATGLFVVRRAWFVIASILTFVGWGLTLSVLPSSPLNGHYGFSFFIFWALAFTFHLVLRNTLLENARLQLSDHDQKTRLASALEELRKEQREKDQAFVSLEDYNLRLQEILQHVPLIVCSLDMDGRILLIEGRGLEVLDREPAELEGRLLESLHFSLAPLLQVWDEATTRREVQDTIVLFDRVFDIRLRVIDDREGVPRSVVAVLLDITAQHESQRAREQFVSLVSHELRTPLTALNGSLRLVQSDVAFSVEERHKMFEIMERNVERLHRIIDDLLDLQKMREGQLSFRLAPHDLNVLIQWAIENIQTYTIECDVSVSFTKSSSPCWVEVDDERITQVVNNLLSNALKFSPKGGVVQVSLEEQEGEVVVWIKDQGPGVDSAFAEKIFEPFVQADSSSRRTKGGTGLGLNIARQFLHRMKGELGLHLDEEPGATFWFRLPKLR